MTVGPDRHPKVPDRIPTGPDFDVAFEDLVEREHLGSGGAADVVKMAIRGTDEVVAVKQPRAERTLRSETVEAFVEEADTWSRLDDLDHVVGVVSWGREPLPWIALEYMDGGPLDERFDDHSPAEGLWIAACVAESVDRAHRRGVSHLDLKPGNVLFRSTGPGVWDVPKVSDWGLANRSLQRSADEESDFSPRYAAPEQLSDEFGTPGHRTDVYQLGTLAYELLTGEPPFSGRATTVTRRHLTATPDPPSSVDSSVPSDADDVVLRALRKVPEDRYESMLDFRRELSSLFEDVASGDAATGDASASASGEADSGGDASGEGDGPGFGGGSPFGDASSRAMDAIRDESGADRDKEFPWQHRDDPPGLDRGDDEDDADRS